MYYVALLVCCCGVLQFLLMDDDLFDNFVCQSAFIFAADFSIDLSCSFN